MNPDEINAAITFITCIGIGVYFVRQSYKKVSDRLENDSIVIDLEKQLDIYHKHFASMEAAIKTKEETIEKLYKENMELKNINQTMLKDNTYLRDKLNSEKKW